MTALYGSIRQPQLLFGEGTEELNSFYKALVKTCPGACELLEDLRNLWQPWTEAHAWTLPDTHTAYVPVTDKVDATVRVDALGGGSFRYRYKELAPSAKGLSLIANVIHSVDGYVVRSMVRRCSYDPVIVKRALRTLTEEVPASGWLSTDKDVSQLTALINKYAETNMVDMAIIPFIHRTNIVYLPAKLKEALIKLIESVIEYPPFDIITIHDQFSCHANHVNQMRFHYKEIMAELAESTILSDIFSTISGNELNYLKLSEDLGDKIRQSNYAIC